MNRFAPHLLSFFVFLSGSVAIAEDGRRPATSRTERIARANWSPIRGAQGSVRQVAQDAEDNLPAPVQNNNSVMEPIPVPMGQPLELEQAPIYGEAFLDEPIMGSLACDAMGCSGPGCGGCGGVGCDSMGGNHCGCGVCRGGRRGWWPCITLCLPQDGWFHAEYLNWQQKGMYLPPLVTQGNAIGTAPIIGRTGVSVIYGDDNDYLEGDMSGLRLNFGVWLDPCHEWAVAADYFGFEQLSEQVTFSGNAADPSLGRPINNVALANSPAGAELVNFIGDNVFQIPVNVSGSVRIDSDSQLRSGGFQFRRFLVARDGCGDTVFYHLPQRFRSRIDLGIGYRYTQLDEGLHITESLLSNGTGITLDDDFDTRTQFNGFDFGMYYTRMRGNWSVDLQGRFGLGTNRQRVAIDGSRVVAGVPFNGGLLAQTTNEGIYDRDRFSVLPEFRANLGYHLTPRFRLTVGYTFMYWSNVVRPGDQIDLNVDQDLLLPAGDPTATRPSFAFNETDYWAHGISFGGDYRW